MFLLGKGQSQSSFLLFGTRSPSGHHSQPGMDLAPNVSLSSFWMRILKVWGSSEVPISKFPVSGLQGPLSHPAMSWGSDPGRALGRAVFAGRSRELRASPNHGAEGAPEGKGSTESLPMLL